MTLLPPDPDYHNKTGLGPGKYVTRSMLVDYFNASTGFEDRWVQQLPIAQFSGNSGTDFGTLFEHGLVCAVNGQSTLYVPDAYLTKSGAKSTTVEAVAWRAQQKADGIHVVSDAELELLRHLIDKTMRNPFCRWLLEKVDLWSPVYRWTDEETGLPLQVEWDAIATSVCQLDIKTTRSPLSKWPNVTREWGYDFQAALYSDAYEHATGERLGFAFIVAQTQYPFEVSPESIPRHVVEACQVKYRQALRGIAAQDWGNDDRETKVREWPAYIDFQLQTETG